MLAPALFSLFGALLLIGEYLCVEIAWKCMTYSTWIVSTGVSLIGVSIIMVVGMLGMRSKHKEKSC